MGTSQTVVLCAGDVDYKNTPFGFNQTHPMIPIHGKPVIGWILDDLIDKGIKDAVLVLRRKNTGLSQYVERVYVNKLKIELVKLDTSQSIVHSLMEGLLLNKPEGLVRVVLGDTLVLDKFSGTQDFVYVGQVQDPQRWCVVELGDEMVVSEYYDKQKVAWQNPYVIAGYYQFQDAKTLMKCVRNNLRPKAQLSHVLREYGRVHPIRAKKVKKWHDFGHVDRLTRARRELLNSRHFNSIKVDPTLDTITKRSKNTKTLQDELYWYMNIPDELKILTPRVIRSARKAEHFYITQEYYGYPTLNELYVHSELSLEIWTSVLNKLLSVHKKLRSYKGALGKRDIEQMYLDKTFGRLADLRKYRYWDRLLKRDEIKVNGVNLVNVGGLEEKIVEAVSNLVRNSKVSIIHGDLHFSNILYDLNHQIVKLVDPRGSFGQRTIYGDPRYDIAKLRHSVSGMYDYIVSDMFTVKGAGGSFDVSIFNGSKSSLVADRFDAKLKKLGYDLGEIKLIEGLLFLSMLPLHMDKRNRQVAFFARSLTLLNEVLLSNDS